MARNPAKPRADVEGKAADDELSPLTFKQRIFVDAYLGEAKGNATEAARIAGYAHPNVQGSQCLTKLSIRLRIDARLDEVALTSKEILGRLSDMGTADMRDFVAFGKSGGWSIDIQGAVVNGKSHLIRKIKSGKYGPEIELYDAKGSLELLGKYRGLWKDDAENASPEAEMFRKALAAVVTRHVRKPADKPIEPAKARRQSKSDDSSKDG